MTNPQNVFDEAIKRMDELIDEVAEGDREIKRLKAEKKELIIIADWFYCEVDPETKYQRQRLEKKYKRLKELILTQK